MTGHALDSGGVEQIGSVGQRSAQAFAAFQRIQGQIELGGQAVPVQALDAQTRQLLHPRFIASAALLVVVHDLEQRVMAEAALRVQGFDQLLERQVLMPLGAQYPLLDLGQQAAEAQCAVELGLKHLGVDEEADQALGFHPVAVGGRYPDADFTLPAVALQQGLERRQQHHEQRHAFALGQGSELTAEAVVEGNRLTRATVALHARARPVAGQFKHWLLTVELRQPVLQLAFTLARLHPVPLPDGVVGVLDR
ncbi:hypothetical protein D3C81_843010 [compost metagenome]